VAIVVLALGAAALVVVIAWSAVESRLAGWALTSLAGRFGIVAQARELDLDLARLDIHVRGLTLASPVSPDAPFFTVDEARLDLPWSVLRGKIAIDAVELVRPRLTIVAKADGTSNLPAGDRTSATPGSSDDTADPPRLPIGALTVDGLSIEWRDDASGLGLTVGSASLSLAPEGDVIRGAIRLEGAAVFVWEARTVTIASLDGGLTFDGSGLGLDQLRLVIDQSTVTANGRVDGLFGALHIEVDYEAILELADVASLLGLDTTGVDGRVVATGNMTGPLAQPEITAALDSRGLRWGALEVDALDGRVRWVEDALTVDTATIRLADGEIVTGVSFPVPEAAHYQKFDQPASRFALVGVFVARYASGVRVAVTGASEAGVHRWSAAETALSTNFSADAVPAAPASDDMIGDIHGTPEYRANLVRVMTRRAVAAS